MAVRVGVGVLGRAVGVDSFPGRWLQPRSPPHPKAAVAAAVATAPTTATQAGCGPERADSARTRGSDRRKSLGSGIEATIRLTRIGVSSSSRPSSRGLRLNPPTRPRATAVRRSSRREHSGVLMRHELGSVRAVPETHPALDWLARRHAGESAALIAQRAGVSESIVRRATRPYGPFPRPSSRPTATTVSERALSARAASGSRHDAAVKRRRRLPARRASRTSS